MEIKGMDTHFISVSSLERSLAFYGDWMGMEVVADETLPPDEIQRLWQLPAVTQARAAWLKSRMQTTILGLIEFQPNSGKAIRQPMTWDYGHWALAFWARDTVAIYEELMPKGYTFVCPPISWKPVWLPITVQETVFVGPDNVTIGTFEKVPAGETESPHNIIRLDHCAQYVKDIDQSIKFYCDVLGLNLRERITLPTGLLDKLMAVPPGTEVQHAMIQKRDQASLNIQLLQASVAGKSLTAIARPPNLGVFLSSYEVDYLSQFINKLGEAGAPIVTGPVELHDKVHGRLNVVITAGPNGELIQLFER